MPLKAQLIPQSYFNYRFLFLSLLDRLHLEEEARFQSFFLYIKNLEGFFIFCGIAEMFWHCHK
jgi:hypothetical protein